jgi:sugar phosphate isomerase/epimerase
MTTRRKFLTHAGLGALGLYLVSGHSLIAAEWGVKKPFFKISLAEWSLHKTLFSGELTNLDFPETARKKFDIGAVEYVNQFFKDKANDQTYLKELLQRSRDNGIKNVLIMVDGEGDLGSTDEKERLKAVENHYKWVEAAKFLGCHAIRVNAAGKGTAEVVQSAAVDGLGRLSEFASGLGMNVVVENHGSYSSQGDWLASVMELVDRKNCGTLPDFGNFEDYDPYKAVEEMMPYAKGVSAKARNFDSNGLETKIDYERMLKIVKDAGFSGYIGIEYSGENEAEGIKKTKLLLERTGIKLS